MKAWTTQFVTSLWASGGFDAIAGLHNRELEQLEGQMNNNSKEAQVDNGENISADREQDAIIARQQNQIEALTAGLQKVSAQLAAGSPSLADSN